MLHSWKRKWLILKGDNENDFHSHPSFFLFFLLTHQTSKHVLILFSLRFLFISFRALWIKLRFDTFSTTRHCHTTSFIGLLNKNTHEFVLWLVTIHTFISLRFNLCSFLLFFYNRNENKKKGKKILHNKKRERETCMTKVVKIVVTGSDYGCVCIHNWI